MQWYATWPACPAMVSTAAMPSSSALWASIGPRMQSPIAQMPSTRVRKWSSTTTRPRGSSSTPASSAPTPSVQGRRPTATSRTWHSSSRLASPSRTVTRTRSPSTRARSAEARKRNLMPCSSSARWSSRALWRSIPGTTPGVSSSTVTSLPSRSHTDPSSSPIAVDDAVVVRPMMYVALSYDHRIVDGEQAVTFLVRVKDRLEDPERMLFEL